MTPPQETEIVAAPETVDEGPTLAETLSAMDPNIRLVPEEGAEEQPRDEFGRFASEDEPGEEPAVEATAEPEIEEPEPEEEPQEALAPEAREEGDPEETTDPVRLRVPSAEGEEALEILIDADDETREHLETLQAQADRAVVQAQQIEAYEGQQSQVEANMAELDAIEHELRIDPAGYLLEHIGPAQRAAVATALLHDEEVYDLVSGLVQDWDVDPAARKLAAAEAKTARLERKGEVQDQLNERKSYAQGARALMVAINGLVPPGMSLEDANDFKADSHRDILNYIAEHELTSLGSGQVPGILARRMRRYGIDTKTTGEPVRTPSGVTEDTGKRLRASLDRRAAAAATAPASAGHIPSKNRPPKDATLEDSFKWAEQRFAR